MWSNIGVRAETRRLVPSFCCGSCCSWPKYSVSLYSKSSTPPTANLISSVGRISADHNQRQGFGLPLAGIVLSPK